MAQRQRKGTMPIRLQERAWALGQHGLKNVLARQWALAIVAL
jgi:hypothetical protein